MSKLKLSAAKLTKLRPARLTLNSQQELEQEIERLGLSNGGGLASCKGWMLWGRKEAEEKLRKAEVKA